MKDKTNIFAIRNDKMKRKKLARAVYKSVIKAHTPKTSFKDVYGFVRVRPFFLFYRQFYNLVYSFLGLDINYKFEEYFS